MMKRLLVCVLCALAVFTAQGRSLKQNATNDGPFATSIKAANITASVSFTIGLLDLLGEWPSTMQPPCMDAQPSHSMQHVGYHHAIMCRALV